MADRETISDVVAAYGRILGLSDLELDQDGQCHLQFDERLPVSLAVADEGEELVAVAAVGELGPAPPQAAMALLLDANFLGRGTRRHGARRRGGDRCRGAERAAAGRGA